MASTTQVEVESKFDVDESFRLPDLLTVPSVKTVESPQEQNLEATYFDTADLRLLGSRITLRRRTGGQDAGWHLKLPTVGTSRLEVHEPLGQATRTVPPKLSSLVRVRVRSAALVPVAQLKTRRVVHRLLGADGAVLAEVSDDTVVATTMGTEPGEATTTMTFREVEVELVKGGEELLESADPVLRAAGARPAASAAKLAKVLEPKVESLRQRAAEAAAAEPAGSEAAAHDEQVAKSAEMKAEKKAKKKAKRAKQSGPTAGEVAMQYVAAQVEELQSWDPHVRVDREDAVHKMRVSARRLRSALATDRPLLDRAVTDPIRDELRWLGVVLGAARDAEVMHERLCKEVNQLPPELVVGPVIARIDTELKKRYREAHDAVLVELDGQRYLSLVDSLEELVASPPFTERASRPAEKEITNVVRRTRRRVERAVEALDQASDAVQRDHLLHEVRKAAKRARYAGESVVDLFGDRASDYAEIEEGFQEILGTHQDSVVAREELRAMGMRAHLAGENGFTFGLLYGKQMAYAEDDERSFRKAWSDAGTHMKWP
jgi:CHAD domain-containing protein